MAAEVHFGAVRVKTNESRAISLLHTDAMPWFAPSERVIRHEHRQRRDVIAGALELEARTAGKTHWGFKEPSSIFFFDFWLEAIPELEFIGTFRRPDRVVAHFKRDWPTMRVEQLSNLWCTYNEALLALHDQFRFPLISFDADASQYEQRLRAVFDEARIVAPEGVQLFDDSKRLVEAEHEVAWTARMRAAYDELERRAT